VKTIFAYSFLNWFLTRDPDISRSNVKVDTVTLLQKGPVHVPYTVLYRRETTLFGDPFVLVNGTVFVDVVQNGSHRNNGGRKTQPSLK
jgi:hypothetical protein